MLQQGHPSSFTAHPVRGTRDSHLADTLVRHSDTLSGFCLQLTIAEIGSPSLFTLATSFKRNPPTFFVLVSSDNRCSSVLAALLSRMRRTQATPVDCGSGAGVGIAVFRSQPCRPRSSHAGRRPDAPPDHLDIAFPARACILLVFHRRLAKEISQRHLLSTSTALPPCLAEVLFSWPYCAQQIPLRGGIAPIYCRSHHSDTCRRADGGPLARVLGSSLDNTVVAGHCRRRNGIEGLALSAPRLFRRVQSYAALQIIALVTGERHPVVARPTTEALCGSTPSQSPYRCLRGRLVA